MKKIDEFLKTKKQDSESIDANLEKALLEYAKFYKYDATQLIASILWFMQDRCKNDETRTELFDNGDAALKTWKEEFLKAQGIVG